MYPTNPTRYPQFVADQILTAQNLQDLFNYLDEQERLTRTNLIGIGIVCGLEAYTHASGTSINISKGVGVTSAGYLVSVPAAQYTHYSPYNAEKEAYYEKFVDIDTKKQRFPLWELARKGSPQAISELDKSFLSDKIILVFVELLQTGNKNCDPDSCDDKGITIDIQFRFLLVEEKNVSTLIGLNAENDFFKPGPKCMSWPELKLPRYNVPASTLPDAASIFKNYFTILNEAYLKEVEKVLTHAYAGMQLLVASDLPNNPFSKLADKLSFLYDGSINLNQLIMLQYYYDFISDLLQGYEELRNVCHRYVSICCPDVSLFPRHLLLYAAFPSKTLYRHRFIPSASLHAGESLVEELKFLMRRLSVMVQMVQIPPVLPASQSKRKLAEVRITPSKLGDVALSQKAIPYYYDVLDTPSIINHWNHQKTQMGKGSANLSYYAVDYNATDDHVRFPLKYDLEPYNFLRIEGHIGKTWQTAFQEIYQIKYKHRLPFEVVALNGDFKSLLAFVQQSVADLGKVLEEHPEQWRKILCYFTDIEMQYDMQAAELRCTMGKVMRFLYSMVAEQTAGAAGKPVSDLLQKFDPGFVSKAGTMGQQFDEWYPGVKNTAYLAPAQLLPALSVNLGAGKLISPVALMYYLEKIHEALPDGIVQVNMADLQTRLRDAVVVAEAILKAVKSMAANTDNKQFDDPEYYLQLNAVIRICKGSLLLELYRNFIFRFYLYLSNQSFAMFSFLHSGIQHKGGVPVGGTFVMVYHDAMPLRNSTNNFSRVETNVKSNTTLVNKKNTESIANANAGLFKRMAVEKDSMISKIREQASALSKLDTSEKMFAMRKEVSNVQSVKDTGMFFISEVVAARAAEDELTDKELLELVQEIPDGTVIADFYLPYICASECMPMSFVVLGKEDKPEDPAKPTISSKISEFCQADTVEYELTVTPPPAGNAAVTGEGTSLKNNKAFFQPSKVNLGTALQKEVRLVYTVGAQSAETKVQVYAQPKASFNASASPTGSPEIVLSNVVANGNVVSWSIAGKQVSTDANPGSLKVDKPGTYVITLQVKNGVCTEAAANQTVVIGTPTPTATCRPLQQWSDAFQKWNQPTQRIFVMFMRQYGSYAKVAAFFLQQMPQVFTLPPDKQVETLAGMAHPGIIQEWMQELNKIVIEGGATRTIALELYRILEGMLLFYACVQPQDIDAAKVPVETPLKVDFDLVSAWANAAPNFTDPDKEIIKRKMEDLEQEINNIKTNAPHKKIYGTLLTRILKLLSTYL